MFVSPVSRWVLFNTVAALCISAPSSAEAQQTLRSQASVNLTFDEAEGPFKDSATVGQSADDGQPINDPARVSSPFWNQDGKRAVQFDAAKQQYIEIADGPDLDRTDALTLSLLFVNLQDPADAAYHGLVAKRGQVDGKIHTNFGINFAQQGDILQVYLSDGSGYKVTHFSTQSAIPTRKLTFLTATYQVADAPGQDADTDADDVRIQLYSNGEPLKPKAAPNGFVEGNDAWILDINPAELANSLPLTIGRSEATAGEYLTGVVDEFSLFPTALNGDQVRQLFLEVAGANVRELIAQEGPAAAKSPVITSLSQPAVTIGQPTSLIITGSELGPEPKLFFPVAGIGAEVTASEPGKLTVQILAPTQTVPGLYPIWVATANGISRPLPLIFDRMRQLPLPTTGPEAPQDLPAAFFGTLSGSAQPKVYFAGKKSQRVVADVDLKRLGGAANPVLEITSAQGTPLSIGWGHHSLSGDCRAETILPRDGIYAVELHDLTFNAPGQSVYRLKIGDLKLLDATLPAEFSAAQANVIPIGTGFSAGQSWLANIVSLPESRFGLLALPAEANTDGYLPVVQLGAARETVEAATDGQPQVVAATFPDATTPPVGINGRLLQRGERDKYLLQVTPGQKLQFTLQTRSLSSAVDGEITLFQHPQGNVLAMSAEQPSLTDVVLEYTVPADQTQLLVSVRDLLNRGGERALYRLEIMPAGRPSFELLRTSPVLDVPSTGTALMELQVTRRGYDGPIALRVSGDDGIVVSPAQIPAGISGKTLVRLSRSGTVPRGTAKLVRLIGTSVGIEPPVSQTARSPVGSTPPAFLETLAVGTPAPSGLSLELASLPTVLFRGVPLEIPAVITRQPGSDAAGRPIRFAITTTEVPRLRVANNPAAGNLPMVGLAPAGLIAAEITNPNVTILAPVEVADATVELAIRAEAIVHAYSDRVQATADATPFRLPIQNAVAPQVDAPTLAIVTNADHRLTGQLQRTAGFTGPVEVTVVGLPAEYVVTPAVIPGDQNAFAVVIKGPAVAAEQALANVRLRVTTQGSLIFAEQPLTAKAVPPAN